MATVLPSSETTMSCDLEILGEARQDVAGGGGVEVRHWGAEQPVKHELVRRRHNAGGAGGEKDLPDDNHNEGNTNDDAVPLHIRGALEVGAGHPKQRPGPGPVGQHKIGGDGRQSKQQRQEDEEGEQDRRLRFDVPGDGLLRRFRRLFHHGGRLRLARQLQRFCNRRDGGDNSSFRLRNSKRGRIYFVEDGTSTFKVELYSQHGLKLR